MTTSIDRRKFVAAAAGTAVTAAVAGVGGELLISKRFKAAPPLAMASPPTVKVTPPRIVKQKPLPAEDSLNISGLSPFYTPNGQFYRVDTSLTVPQVSAATWQLRIHGMVDNPMTITFNQLSRMPMTEHDVTLTCVSEAVGGGYIGNARWQGTLLAPLLRKAGIQAGADQIVMRDVNNMTIGVATDPVMDGRESLLAVAMNGQPLPAPHGYPVRVVIPGLYGYVSATKWVVDMELTTFGAFNAYWVKQGWSQQGPIKTESRIDVPKTKAGLTGWAGHDRRRGLGPAQGHRGRRGQRGRHLVYRNDGRSGHHRHLAPVVLRVGRDPGAARAPGPGDRQDRPHPDCGEAPDRAQRRDRVPHHPGERDLTLTSQPLARTRFAHQRLAITRPGCLSGRRGRHPRSSTGSPADSGARGGRCGSHRSRRRSVHPRLCRPTPRCSAPGSAGHRS